jgi:hypothetical protein
MGIMTVTLKGNNRIAFSQAPFIQHYPFWKQAKQVNLLSVKHE